MAFQSPGTPPGNFANLGSRLGFLIRTVAPVRR